MAQLYCLNSLHDFHQGINRTVLNFELDGIFASGCNYVLYESTNKSIEVRLSINKLTGELCRIIFLFSSSPIFCDKGLELSTYLRFNCSPQFALDGAWSNIDTFPHTIIKKSLKSYLYNNALLVAFHEPSRSHFFFQECNNFGILTDKDFVVTGFVVFKFAGEDQKIIDTFKLGPSVKGDDCEKFSIQNKRMLPMHDKQFLINKILELKNVALPELVFYGYAKQIIDEEFIIDFAMRYLVQKGTDEPIWVELASLNPQNITKDDPILSKLEIVVKNSSQVLTEQMPLYNKIWVYLFSVSTMKELNIVE
jgi:hypothetical protein